MVSQNSSSHTNYSDLKPRKAGVCAKKKSSLESSPIPMSRHYISSYPSQTNSRNKKSLSDGWKESPITDQAMSDRIEAAIAAVKTCPICFHDNYGKAAAAAIKDCMHVYCIKCIEKWSKLNQTCPICKSKFDSWFYRCGKGLRKHDIAKLDNVMEVRNLGENVWTSLLQYFRRGSTAPTRFEPIHNQDSGHTITTSPEIIRETRLQWRRRVYDQNLRAVPYQSLEFDNRVRDFVIAKDRVLKKITPWILRELEAITRIPDPSVIVHVATAVYFEALDKWSSDKLLRSIAEEVEKDDSFLDPLRRFLYDKTNLFWHELKCFSQSHLSIEKYDTLVQYTDPAASASQ